MVRDITQEEDTSLATAVYLQFLRQTSHALEINVCCSTIAGIDLYLFIPKQTHANRHIILQGCCYLLHFATVTKYGMSSYQATYTREYRIIEWLSLKGTFKNYSVQLPYHGQEHLSLNQVAQSPF